MTWREDDRLKDDLSQCGVTRDQQVERRLTVRCSAHLCKSRASCLFMSFVLVYVVSLLSTLVLMKFLSLYNFA